MKMKRKARLQVEQMDERLVPASISFGSGVLNIRPSTGETGMRLTVTQSSTTANKFTVVDTATGSSSQTFSGVSNISITGANGADSITVDVNGQRYTGALFVNSGSGNDTVTVTNSGAGVGAAASILGAVNISGSSGNHTVNLDNLGSSRNLTFGGGLQVVNSSGINTLNFGGPVGNNGQVTNVQGDFSITNFQTVTMGQVGTETISGTLSIQDYSAPGNDSITLGDGVSVGRSLTFQSGSLSNTSVSIGNDTIGVNLSLNLGSGTDTVTIGATAATTVNNNLSITEGNGSDSINVNANVFGNLSFNMGSGDDTVNIVNAPGGGSGGRLSWTSGNGNDSVHLGADAFSHTAADGEFWNVNMSFGSGNDSLTLDPGAGATTPLGQTISGSINGGAGANFFDSDSWNIVQPWNQQNF